MNLTFEYDPDNVRMNQQAKYLGKKSFSSNVITQTLRRTHLIDRST